MFLLDIGIAYAPQKKENPIKRCLLPLIFL
ncbi:hypothetical protein NC652_009911 [Populus alba x Populus x berolinensis]|uniref:Uncharacterized protein n=1 Tax=Populus alba x Populus x berolinensis TaxID=444605 RepID=A0AAD6RAH5_9ROSI|nr:hypothetical protein NC652_009911 [Populus alba x Populus x berolinensis]KAJ7005279.1 hypothetical protein NC653_009930 [Populus alba x Populus x berolinensis]